MAITYRQLRNDLRRGKINQNLLEHWVLARFLPKALTPLERNNKLRQIIKSDDPRRTVCSIFVATLFLVVAGCVKESLIPWVAGSIWLYLIFFFRFKDHSTALFADLARLVDGFTFDLGANGEKLRLRAQEILVYRITLMLLLEEHLKKPLEDDTLSEIKTKMQCHSEHEEKLQGEWNFLRKFGLVDQQGLAAYYALARKQILLQRSQVVSVPAGPSAGVEPLGDPNDN